MCGILAVMSRDGSISMDSLQRGIASMRHRGPDGVGSWLSKSRGIALGHARLSIIDLISGQQPIASEDDNLRVVVNGEFYDYQRIQAELTSRGHKLRTGSDSEIALHLFEESGIGFLQYLRGEFAFALWDEREQTLIAVRDRFGIKPLYYTELGGKLRIASEVKALVAMGVRLEWDEASLAQSFYANPAPSRTLFAGIRQVPPGCYLRATKQGVTVAPYWELNFPRQDTSAVPRVDEDWIDCLREQAKEAVRLRMRADVPVGALLSGGLDSSATLGMARRFTSSAIEAFTIAFDHPSYDESPVARQSAMEFGAEFHPIHVTNSDFAEVFPEAVWHSEGVHYNAHGAARFILSRSIREAGIKVVLSGEGADEIAAGYRFFEKALALSGVNTSIQWPLDVLQALSAGESILDVDSSTAAGLEAMAKALDFPFSMVANMTGQQAMGHGLIDAEFASRNSDDGGAFAFFRQFDVAKQIDGREPVRQLMHLWMGSGFANYVLGGERLDMAHGIEQRLPFLDHIFFEHAREVPVSLLRRDGREKWALRQALRPFVSTEVYDRKKQPFFAPPSMLQDGSAMFALAQDLLRSETIKSLPFLNYRSIIKLLDQFPDFTAPQRAQLDPLILMLMSLCVLHDRYVSSCTAASRF